MKRSNLLTISALFSLCLAATVAKTALAEDGGNLPAAAASPAQENNARPDFAGNGGPQGIGDHEPGAMREKLKNMNPEDRKAFFEKRKERLQNMTPEQRDALKKKREAWLNSLSPEKRAQFEERRKKRQEMREKLKNMSPEERQAAMEKFRERKGQRGDDDDRGPDGGKFHEMMEHRGDGKGEGGGNFRKKFGGQQGGATPAAPAGQ